MTMANSSTEYGSLAKWLHWLAAISKWSMLDVFVVAVLVVAVKLDLVLEVQVHFGLYAFSVAVLMTMYITAQVVELSNRCLGKPDLSP